MRGETVWKYGMGCEIGVSEAAKRGRKSPDRALFSAREARSRGPRLFSKQFRKGLLRSSPLGDSLGSLSRTGSLALIGLERGAPYHVEARAWSLPPRINHPVPRRDGHRDGLSRTP